MKKGISLVALVITIIVLIILTGAVIATFMDGGIIDKAKDSVLRSDCATLQEAYTVEYNKAKISYETGSTDVLSEKKSLIDAAEELRMEKDFEYDAEKDICVYKGDNQYIAEWVTGLGVLIGEEGEIEGDFTNAGYLYNNGFVTNVEIGTTFEDMEAKLGEKYLIVLNENREGNLLGTGDKIVNYETNEEIATILIYGDYTGDGEADVKDVIDISQFLEGTDEEINDKASMDTNGDGYVTYADVYFFRKNITGGYGVVLDQNRKYNKNIEVIGIEKIVNGMSTLGNIETIEITGGDMLIITLNETATVSDLYEMFMPYMKTIYSIIDLENVEDPDDEFAENINYIDYTTNKIKEELKDTGIVDSANMSINALTVTINYSI